MSVGLLSFGAPPVYEGLVASRARMTQTSDTTNKYLMSRSAHVAAESLASIKIAFSNFWNTGQSGAGPVSDTGQGAVSAITASIEYPAGTFAQVLFSASASGSIPDAGLLFSDYITVSIPSGATFWVRSFIHNTSGLFYNSHQNSTLGEATALSATVITDQTMSGTITNSGSFSYPPLAVLGMTRNPSVIIVHDSIGAGNSDTEDSSASATGWNCKIGIVARSMGNTPFLNLSVGGEAAANFLTHGSARKLMIPKGSYLITGLGVNDFQALGRSAAQVTADTQAIWALKSTTQKAFQATITPHSTSADSFATVVGQTPVFGEANRTTFNTAARAIIAGSNGCYDVAGVLESSLNSGAWVVSPSPPYTVDGLHPNVAGYALVPPANVIGPFV